jgi:hypothetical protein
MAQRKSGELARPRTPSPFSGGRSTKERPHCGAFLATHAANTAACRLVGGQPDIRTGDGCLMLASPRSFGRYMCPVSLVSQQDGKTPVSSAFLGHVVLRLPSEAPVKRCEPTPRVEKSLFRVWLLTGQDSRTGSGCPSSQKSRVNGFHGSMGPGSANSTKAGPSPGREHTIPHPPSPNDPSIASGTMST